MVTGMVLPLPCQSECGLDPSDAAEVVAQVRWQAGLACESADEVLREFGGRLDVLVELAEQALFWICAEQAKKTFPLPT